MVTLASRGLRFYALSVILYGIDVVFINYTQGMRRMTLSNIVCFLANFVYIVAPALLMFGWLDTDAVWIAFIIGEFTTLVTIIIMAAVKKRGMPYKVGDYLFLKEPFGVSDENLFETSISEKGEIIPASEAVNAFCTERGASTKISTLMSLFVEELSNNIVEFGFADGKKHSIDIRVIKDKDGWILRFRDNCKLFDPTEWIKLHNSDDPTANIGIRMVCGMAKETNYLSTMELNNLTIKL